MDQGSSGEMSAQHLGSYAFPPALLGRRSSRNRLVTVFIDNYSGSSLSKQKEKSYILFDPVEFSH